MNYNKGYCTGLFKVTFLRKILYFFFFLLSLETLAKSDKLPFYDKHVVIIVDQTIKAEKKEEMSRIGADIKNFLLNKANITSGHKHVIPEKFNFNPQKDELSLYVFGLVGKNEDKSTPYAKIGQLANSKKNPDYVTSEIVNNLIHKRATYQTSTSDDFAEFLDSNLLPLFERKDDVYNQICKSEKSGISLSYYVYPCILELVNTSVPTKEYNIIIVSDYRSGTTNSDADDLERLQDLVHHKNEYVENFKGKMNDLKKPFYQIEELYIDYNGGNKAPIAKGFSLKLRALEKVQPYFNSNLLIEQTDYNKTTYDISDLRVAFNHEKKDLIVNSLILNIWDKSNDALLYSKDYPVNSEGYDYIIPGAEVNLGKVFDVGDEVNVECVFLTMAKDKDASDLMPLVYSTERNYEFSSSDIVSKYEAKNIFIIYYLICTLILAAAIIISCYIYRKRGKVLPKLKFSIWPITNTRFMEVKDKKVISHDCWYWQRGENSRNIVVRGHVDIPRPAFAKRYKYIVQQCIEDIDLNEDFSFRPDVNILNADGSIRKEGEFYKEDMSPEGNFSFNVNAYMNPDISQPNFSLNNILCTRITVRVLRVEGDKEVLLDEMKQEYHFIVKPKIDNSNLWMAFDPGTTGSCVAYGAAANPTDTNDIFMAENEYEDIRGDKHLTPIFPSKIKIVKNSERIMSSKGFSAEELEEGDDKDFLFGNMAEILWGKGINCFQSIKKLLGYKTPQSIIVGPGNDKKEISGQDLAHLVVKGLYNHLEEYLRKDTSTESQHIREMFIKNGELIPQRAIVAVPNNYTLVKIQEMVDSVKRLGKFKEVHYIYESEAVMMTYFRKNWSDLDKLQNRLFVVYDMGGATINTTAFRINVNIEAYRGNKFIRNIDVTTVAKIGYGIGGDDIDFAIINIIYGIPTVRTYLNENGIDATIHQRRHKSRLITMARRLKLDYIDKFQDRVLEGNVLIDAQALYGHVRGVFESIGIQIGNGSEEDFEYLDHQFSISSFASDKEEVERTVLNEFVLKNVADAVQELLSAVKEFGTLPSQVELIMSGRSVLYPGIKDTVLHTINKSGFKCSAPWDGFNGPDGFFVADEVKKAVAVGACWYAMYSNRINVRHNQVTSAFGFIDNINMKQKFIPIITRKDKFAIQGENAGTVTLSASPNDETLSHIRFVQMLGTNYDEILEKKILHKMNVLDEVYPRVITALIENIEITIDEKGNFDYNVKVAGRTENITIQNNPDTRLSENGIRAEIFDENSLAYMFATLNAIVENDISVFEDETQSKENKKPSSKRF